MNWGIFTLLGVVLTVLSGVLVFFVHVIRNEESASPDAPPESAPDMKEWFGEKILGLPQLASSTAVAWTT